MHHAHQHVWIIGTAGIIIVQPVHCVLRCRMHRPVTVSFATARKSMIPKLIYVKMYFRNLNMNHDTDI